MIITKKLSFNIYNPLKIHYFSTGHNKLQRPVTSADGRRLNFTGGQPNSFSSPSTRASEVARKVNPQSRKRCSWRWPMMRKRSDPLGKSMGNI